jgi:hypothetical protein
MGDMGELPNNTSEEDPIQPMRVLVFSLFATLVVFGGGTLFLSRLILS